MRIELAGVLNAPSRILTTLPRILRVRFKILIALIGVLSLGVGLGCGYLGILYLIGSYVGATMWMPVGFLILSLEFVSIATYCFTYFVS